MDLHLMTDIAGWIAMLCGIAVALNISYCGQTRYDRWVLRCRRWPGMTRREE